MACRSETQAIMRWPAFVEDTEKGEVLPMLDVNQGVEAFPRCLHGVDCDMTWSVTAILGDPELQGRLFEGHDNTRL
jgi:hypothetical protein